MKVLTFPLSNVDRLWAIWQDLNPNSYMSPRQAPYSTFSATGGESQTQDTPLAPFWDKSGSKFWTSAQIKDTVTFGYAYPETQKWRFPDTRAYQAEIRRAVTALYSTNVFANFVANVVQRKKEHDMAVRALAADAKADATTAEEAPALENPAFPEAQAVLAVAAPAPKPESAEEEGKPTLPLPSRAVPSHPLQI
jgi:tyrosinase